MFSFRTVCIAMAGTAAVLILLSGTYVLEPRVEQTYQKLDVMDARWVRSGGTSGASTASFRVDVTLPNGKDHTFRTHENRVAAERYVCTSVAMGHWTGSYHIHIRPLQACS